MYIKSSPMKVLSVTRFLNLSAQNRLPDIVQVGGRYHKRGASAVIGSAGADLLLPAELYGALDGDLITVIVEKGKIDFSTGIPRPNKIMKHDVVFRSQTDFMERSPFNANTAKLWSDFLFATRTFFRTQGLFEVTTPSLVKNPGMEPELEPFATEFKVGDRFDKYFLPTSPELHLKKMIVNGFTDIFEIKTVFRNGELTSYHQPEFSMLEWYRGFGDLELIVEDLCAYIQFIEEKVFVRQSQITSIKKYSVAELFYSVLQFEMTPVTDKQELLQLADKLELMPAKEFTWNDLFHLLWVAKIEPAMTAEPFLLFDFPPSQAALAKINSRGWAERMEFFWHKIEIANAFFELTDPIEQRVRFERDQKLRKYYERTYLEIDETFMRALEVGLPPSGGIALGLDRLFMALMGIRDIRETRAFWV
ncbi:MAG: hypothetical protein A2Z20_09405 [Bdellovibrionales bacterium RBG_16_40_8]|nr:MAG: hypothetical protein A2Z20_09405 [Bdellovibrionales bacterium RBG_16_40_8]